MQGAVLSFWHGYRSRLSLDGDATGEGAIVDG